MSQPLNYRIVFTFTNNAHRPVTLAGEPTDLPSAIADWWDLTRISTCRPDSGHRVRVMSVDECRRVGVR